MNTTSKEAEGEDMILDALKEAKGSKTYSTGKSLAGDTEESAMQMTRVIESYEMQGKQHKLKKGEALCRSGDPGNSMFVVMKGKLAVVIDNNRVGEINTGETVGEIAVLLGENQTRTADLIAEENTVVGIIPGDQFPKLAMLQPAMLISILKSLIKRIDNNYTTMADQGAKEKKSITRLLGKPDVDVEGDHRALAEKFGTLIEEYEMPLYREVELLERNADRIAALKEKYAEWIAEAAAAAAQKGKK
ncbi:MAG: cyclic nucleotide-binding domain-containing protein [Planctomycetes bacterium]|nr:cyclic nucleotide-binding domain-containing protein [Planctomycetota bacterium]